VSCSEERHTDAGWAGRQEWDEETAYTLVHLYNNESTPVPTLRLEVWSSAMAILDQAIGFTGKASACSGC
jgi:hypothetical protein